MQIRVLRYSADRSSLNGSLSLPASNGAPEPFGLQKPAVTPLPLPWFGGGRPVAVPLKQRWRDGTTHEPLELVESSRRLCRRRGSTSSGTTGFWPLRLDGGGRSYSYPLAGTSDHHPPAVRRNHGKEIICAARGAVPRNSLAAHGHATVTGSFTATAKVISSRCRRAGPAWRPRIPSLSYPQDGRCFE